MFPILVEHRQFCIEANAFDDWQMEWVKACLARVIYFRRDWAKEQTYVGCPLNFIADVPLTRKHFPHARFVVTVRDPREAWPSMIDYLTNVTKENALSDSWKIKKEHMLMYTSRDNYKGMAAWEGDDLTHWIDFNKWKTQGAKQLETIWNAEQWTFTPEQTRAALIRREQHKNRPESYLVQPPEKIDSVLGDFYRTALSRT